MSLNVLLMDDDSAAFLIYERLIKDHFGSEVDLDHCKDENLLSEFLSSKRYAALILDQRLSNGTTGLQMVPVIRRFSPTTRILLNSAFGDELLASQAIDAGVDSYVLGRKQNDNELLRILERELYGYSRLENIRAEINRDNCQDVKMRCDEMKMELTKKVETLRQKRFGSI